MRVLCVAEKPSIAKELARILSGGHFDNRAGKNKFCRNFDFPYRLPPPLGDNRDCEFTVTSVLGHLTETDFPDEYRQWSSCDPFALFDAPVVTKVAADHRQLERNLQDEARNADILMIWTDCDREGEHIGYEVVEVCRRANPRLRVRRARFSAIIPNQIHNACRQADDLDMRMVDAVAVRQVLDLRIGATFTRFMTVTLKGRMGEDFDQKLISYGPCQFPTLGFVVDQYNRVQAFVPEPFWKIEVMIERDFEDEEEPVQVKFTWARTHLFDLPIALLLYEETVNRPTATVIKVETKPTTKRKPYPLTTVELQKAGSRLLSMTPKRVLDLAEKLYQKGFLSYPRTETDEYDRQFDFMSLIQKLVHDNAWAAYAQKLIDGDFERPRNGRRNDKAHPPIHPTAAALNVDADERRVYEFVTRRFLASCSSDAKGKETSVEIEIAGEYFSASGLIVLERNYLDIYPYDKWAGKNLPDFQLGEQFVPDVCELEEGSTTKPKLLTEADLVGLMDNNGIGTDATIAEHIAKVIDREYVIAKKEGKENFLIPSSLGVGLVEGYNAIGFDRSLSKPHLRRETEHRLELICDGQQTKAEVLSTSVEEYKEVFIKARRDFDTVVDSVTEYLHGQGEAQQAVRNASRGGRRSARGAATRGARGAAARGAGRGGVSAGTRQGRQDSDDDDSDGGPAAGGGRSRGRGSTRARGTRGGSTRGRGARSTAADDAPAPKRQRRESNKDEPPECSCGQPAVSRTAGQSTANAGRQFYACAKPRGEQCDFFSWADDGGSTSATRAPARRPAQGQRANGAARSGRTVRCNCGLEATSGITASGPNKDRAYRACPNTRNARCGFFEWADEDGNGPAAGRSQPRGGGAGGPAPSSGGSGACFNCGGPHWARDCPEAAGGSNSRSRVGQRGGGRVGGGGGGDGGSNVCFKCNEPGHWASNCPNA
ncbi:hypothetical protein CspHIS471_0507190 [Cutaneotrichosporon sp. HIS471]|nr:hypothetical protein CspHIS471_0507190 [Cutaneotrichosporon sp. HIS471]